MVSQHRRSITEIHVIDSSKQCDKDMNVNNSQRKYNITIIMRSSRNVKTKCQIENIIETSNENIMNLNRNRVTKTKFFAKHGPKLFRRDIQRLVITQISFDCDCFSILLFFTLRISAEKSTFTMAVSELIELTHR